MTTADVGIPDSFPATEESVAEASFDYSQVHSLAKNSLDFLAGLAIPDVYKYAFPPLFLEAWNLLVTTAQKQRDFSQIAVGLPRGFGKTLVLKLLILYIILFTNKRFILVICENEDKAKSILSDVQDMLEEPNIKAAFGDWKLGVESSTLTRKKFGFRGRSIIIKGAGAGTGIRGITEKNRRPDVMVFDDIQSREDSESELLSNALENWMVTTAMKAKSPEGCMYLFIANMYPTKGSLLRRLKKNPNWVKFIVGGILTNGTSLWEELQPLQQLLREFQNDVASGHPEAFYAEVLNDENATVNNLIDLSKVPPYPYEDSEEVSAGSFIVVDPATDKAKADAVSIGVFKIIGGYPVCRHVLEGKLSPGDIIRESLKLAMRFGCTVVAFEATNFQYSLLYWWGQITEQHGISGIQAVDIYSGMSSKHSRIIKMFAQLLPGKNGDPPEIILHPETRAAVFTQVTQFNPLKRDNEDGILDLLTYAPKVVETYGHLIAFNSLATVGELEEHEVIDEAEASPF